ncbi:MAG: methylmalonyl-CoA mutase family protein, partial [Acidobacteriota bacterium]|nr:methylmalonyl-CoA mutase family protein [Acidobacteriota bacterium]
AFRSATADEVDVLVVDNADVRRRQLARLEELKRERDGAATAAALARLTECAGAGGGDGNLLDLAVRAARARATVGEISAALEAAWGRHEAVVRTLSGVYSGAMGESSAAVAEVRARVERFVAEHGRRPRILVAKMGQDGHDRGQKVIATAFADLGFDVDIGSLFQTPAETARQAVENDVHVVGVSSLAAGHLTLVPELRDALAEHGRGDIAIVVGGVVPPRDREALAAAGAVAVFGPGTVIPGAALELLEKLERPEKLGKPGKPGKPEKPEKPEKLGKPGKPKKPKKPGKPGKPKKPKKPGKPGKLEKLGKPRKPTTPGNR